MVARARAVGQRAAAAAVRVTSRRLRRRQVLAAGAAGPVRLTTGLLRRRRLLTLPAAVGHVSTAGPWPL